MGNRSMFVGLDVHKDIIDVSIAEGGPAGEARHYLGRAGLDARVSTLAGGRVSRVSRKTGVAGIPGRLNVECASS